MKNLRSLVVGCIAALMIMGAPAPAIAQDNVAVAINTQDGTHLFRFAFNVARVTGDVVDQGNAAVAYASCESCTTIAIAIQIVLVMSDPSVITPENVAISINTECTLCTTFAGAYQFVIGTGETVRFTAEGQRALAQLRLDIRELLMGEPTLEELLAGLEPLLANLETILSEELVPVGQPEPSVSPAPDDTQAAPSPAESVTPQPEDPSASPSPSSSPSVEPSP